ncbi:GNAT family N-acetyltransferase [Clostridium tunisiense]|uniref:GNAT family N-acetyltransferase n=1 Tax=Clostridium tunisiense TaxID=219748 RepID=UPI0002E7E2DA|nr:GNAT family N-acetyltransferase [Clostridium tunisiense]
MREAAYENYFWQNEKVRLRPWREEDWEWIYNTGFDTSLGRLAGYKVNLPPTVVEAKEYSKEVENCKTKDGRTVYAMETLDGVHVGRIIFSLDEERHGTFGIGLRIAKEYQGKGYGTSAMKILLQYGFMERRLNKCSATVLESNEGSIKLHKKLGYDQEGLLKESIYMNGSYHNEICFGLTKKMYLKSISNICKK